MLKYKILHTASAGSAGSQIPALFLLHPLGQDETYFDLCGPALYIPRNILVISIRAPIAHRGCQGFVWFGPREMAHDVAETSKAIDSLISFLIPTYNINPNAVFLMGYSQGAMIALYHTMCNPTKISAVVSVAGSLGCISNPDQLTQNEKLLASKQFLVAHGTKDEVFDVRKGLEVAEFLRKRGAQTTWLPLEGITHYNIVDRSSPLMKHAVAFIVQRVDECSQSQRSITSQM